ncbi:hypothetical protein LIER_23178 [Lithospermum erythrorhizon]|uniref:Transposase MuDR plant domain-containing protein n=1 Tax=Lithospermum erythrorhizon TaxID=34254 RepID=A0AAV3QZ32_LITER
MVTLDEMLRAEVVGREIRQDTIRDEEENANEVRETRIRSSFFGSLYMQFFGGSSCDSDDGSGTKSEGFVDEEYDMEDDDTLFEQFVDQVKLKKAIDTYNIKYERDIKYVRNEKERVRAVCKDDNCKWFIYAKRLSGETGLQIRKWHLDYTYIPVYDNKTLTSTWLRRHYMKKFRNSPNYKPSDFKKEMSLKLGQRVSRWQAWKAKATVLKAIYGDEAE